MKWTCNDDECDGEEVSAWLHQISQMAFENQGETKSWAIFQGEFVPYYQIKFHTGIFSKLGLQLHPDNYQRHTHLINGHESGQK